MRTIDDAELAGFRHLLVQFDCCRRGETWVPFEIVRRATPIRTLSVIATRIVCERCRSEPRDVALVRLARTRVTPDAERVPIDGFICG